MAVRVVAFAFTVCCVMSISYAKEEVKLGSLCLGHKAVLSVSTDLRDPQRRREFVERMLGGLAASVDVRMLVYTMETCLATEAEKTRMPTVFRCGFASVVSVMPAAAWPRPWAFLPSSVIDALSRVPNDPVARVVVGFSAQVLAWAASASADSGMPADATDPSRTRLIARVDKQVRKDYLEMAAAVKAHVLLCAVNTSVARAQAQKDEAKQRQASEDRAQSAHNTDSGRGLAAAGGGGGGGGGSGLADSTDGAWWYGGASGHGGDGGGDGDGGGYTRYRKRARRSEFECDGDGASFYFGEDADYAGGAAFVASVPTPAPRAKPFAFLDGKGKAPVRDKRHASGGARSDPPPPPPPPAPLSDGPLPPWIQGEQFLEDSECVAMSEDARRQVMARKCRVGGPYAAIAARALEEDCARKMQCAMCRVPCEYGVASCRYTPLTVDTLKAMGKRFEDAARAIMALDAEHVCGLLNADR